MDVYVSMELKIFCSFSKVNCDTTVMREQIREVMRYAGPRMLLHKPVMAIRHVMTQRREKS